MIDRTQASLEWTPAHIVARLDERVVGQSAAKHKLAGALWWNQYRRLLIAAGVGPSSIPPRQNVLLAGPTGTGKTLLARAAAELFAVPFFATSAPSYSAAGYVGLNPEDMVGGLLQVAGGDVARAEGGIVFLDEVDKLRRRRLGGSDDVGGLAVQQALLAFLEGTTALVKKCGDEKVAVETGHITFIAAGAFAGLGGGGAGGRRRPEGGDAGEEVRHVTAHDLIAFGLIPEFVGRFTVRVGLRPLGRGELRRLITAGESAPLNQAAHLFRLHGLDLQVEGGAVEALLDLAEAEGTGARAAAEVVRDRLHHVLDALPGLRGEGLSRVVIDEEVVRRGRAPWKIPGDPFGPSIDLASARERIGGGPPAPPAGVSDTRNWSEARVEARLAEVKPLLGWSEAKESARKWWEAFERENTARRALVLRLAEELLARKVSVGDFFLAYVYSNTDNIQANLHYLDYTRLKKEEERKKREAARVPQPPATPRFRTGDTCPAGAPGRYQFDGFLDAGTEPAPGPTERQVTLGSGETFPPVGPAGLPCWWKKTG